MGVDILKTCCVENKKREHIPLTGEVKNKERMNLKRKIKQFLEQVINWGSPDYFKFHQNRNDRTGALYKAWGHVITSNMGGAYYEFGIYKGITFRESFLTYQNYLNWMHSQSNYS